MDILVQKDEPSARRAVHMVFAGEKVRGDYPEATPDISGTYTIRGIHLVPLTDLVRMKLNSFRSKDETHIVDLDDAGLITPEIEAALNRVQKDRLAQSRNRAR